MPKSPSYVRPAESRHEKVLRNWLTKQGIVYHHKTDAFTLQREGYHDEPLTWQRVINKITLNGGDELRRAPKRTLAALQEHAVKERTAAIQTIVANMEDWPVDPNVWDKWVTAVCHEGHDLTKAVMQHWVWCIRRRLLRLPIKDHICPILYGASGGGKSVEIRKLLAPVDDVVSEQTLAQVCDDRHWSELARQYVVYVDEMAGAQRAELEVLKALITQEYTEAHVFFTQRRERAPQNAMLLGSSNKPVVEIIHDQTSARRYWEVRCRDPLDWAALEHIDRRSMWASVDPLGESPLSGDVLVRVKELQKEKLRLKPPVELWSEEYAIAQGENPLPISNLWAHYRKYCSEGGYYPGTKDKLSRWLSEQKFRKTQVGKGRVRCWCVDQETYNLLNSQEKPSR